MKSLGLLIAALVLVVLSVEIDSLPARIALDVAAGLAVALWTVQAYKRYRSRHTRPDRSYYGRMPDFELPTASDAEHA